MPAPFLDLDHNATSPMHPAALAAWRRGVRLLALGAESRPVLLAYLFKRARRTIAAALGAHPDEIWLTSGGTEANALVIEAACARARAQGRTAHVMTSALEHPSISAALSNRTAASPGTTEICTTVLPTSSDGVCLPPVSLLSPEADLISIMWANNETGVVQPIQALMAACLSGTGHTWLHADGVQAVGRMPVHFATSGLTFLTLAGHKVGAGGSLGVAVVRAGTPFVPPPRFGARPSIAGHEILPAGDNLPAAMALAAALTVAVTGAQSPLADGGARARQRDAFEAELQRRCGPVQILGAAVPRLANTSCVRFVGCRAETLLVALDVQNIGVSLGSACSAGVSAPSVSVRAMGFDDRAAREVLRISWPMAADVEAWAASGRQLLDALEPLCRASRR